MPSLSQLTETIQSTAASLGWDLMAAYLFGSFDTVHQQTESDIDLAVLVEELLIK